MFILVIPALTFYIGRKYEEVKIVNSSITTIENNKVTTVDYLSSTYDIDDESITLKNGKTDNESIFGKPTIADLNIDRKDDAVFFLMQESKGTGVFFYVVTSISNNGVFVGDRISPQNINVDKDGLIKVNYVTRREDEPFTAEPSLGVTKYLRVINGDLVEVKPLIEQE